MAGDQILHETLDEAPATHARIGGFPFSRQPRQLHHRRIGVVLAIGALLFLAATYLLYLFWVTSFRWLSRQPQYQLPISSIVLEPEPPPFFRGGRAAFLEEVRSSAHWGDTISQLELSSEQVADEFRKNPWVLDVERAFYGTGSFTVRLRYHQPVAFVQLPNLIHILVDEGGNIVQKDDIDATHLGAVFKITGKTLKAPASPIPGQVWKLPTDSEGEVVPDRRIVAAAALAGFLAAPGRRAEAARSAALDIKEINVDYFDMKRLFIRNAEAAWIWWDYAPGHEPPGKPVAEEKWAMLERWRESITAVELLPRDRDYLDLSEPRAVVHCFHPNAPHGTKLPAEARQ
jgi:hypothetical protein